MMITQYHFGSVRLARHNLKQLRFANESIPKVSSYKQCTADFKKKISTSISKDGIVKIIAKWNQYCLFVRINTVAS